MTTTESQLKTSLKSPIKQRDNDSMKFIDKDILNSTSKNRKYKKQSTTNNEDQREVPFSPIGKLSHKVSLLFENKIPMEDFYQSLIRNNIDPESKQVNKIINDLQVEGNKRHKETISKLIKVKDVNETSSTLIEKKMICSPVKQIYTSGENESKGLVTSSKESKKRRFDTSQLSTSQLGVNEGSRRRSSSISQLQKINFMRNSSVFSAGKELVSTAMLSSKYKNSIEANNYTQVRIGIDLSDVNQSQKTAKKGIAYKNQISTENTVLSSVKHSQNQVNSEDLKVKIVGLNGKGVNQLTNRDVDQRKTSCNFIEWTTSGKKKATINKASAESLASANTNVSQNQKESTSINSSWKVNSICSPVRNQMTPKTTVNQSFLKLLKG